MAVFTGKVVGSLLGDLYESANAAQRNPFYSGPYVTAQGQTSTTEVDYQAGPVTPVTVNQFPVNHGGTKHEAYVDIFYYRIVVTPPQIDFGNLLVDTSLQIEVWNAFFGGKTLDAVTETTVGGITLTGDARPKAFSALESTLYVAEALAGSGPPTINGSYLFDFEAGIDDVTVAVIGRRVVALPYMFQAGLKETLSWQTKVITSNNGYEQRMKTRRSPRQEFSFDIAIPNGQLSYLDSLLYAWRGNFFGLPVSSEARPLTSATAAIDLVVNVSTLYGDFRVGGLVLIYNSPTDLALFTIESLSSSTITVDVAVGKIFSTTALVMPVRISRLLSSPKRRTTGSRVRMSGNFQVTENIVLATAASATQYKGIDVYLDRPMTIGEYVTDVYTSRVDVVDFGTGVVEVDSPWLKTKIQRNFGIQFDNLEDAWNFRLWLHRRDGKLRPFWMPTFEPNFHLLSTGALTNELIVRNEGQLSLSDGRNDIAIETETGWLLREVITRVANGNDIALGLDTSLAIDASTIIGICWLGRKRLASDRLTFNWQNNQTGNLTVPIIELNN